VISLFYFLSTTAIAMIAIITDDGHCVLPMTTTIMIDSC